jgi:hypothetical protein
MQPLSQRTVQLHCEVPGWGPSDMEFHFSVPGWVHLEMKIPCLSARMGALRHEIPGRSARRWALMNGMPFLRAQMGALRKRRPAITLRSSPAGWCSDQPIGRTLLIQAGGRAIAEEAGDSDYAIVALRTKTLLMCTSAAPFPYVPHVCGSVLRLSRSGGGDTTPDNMNTVRGLS